MKTTVTYAENLNLSENENAQIQARIDELKQKFAPDYETLNIEVALNDDGDIDIIHHVEGVRFERIRRITGYLVGTIDRWNDAKRSECFDRLAHGVS